MSRSTQALKRLGVASVALVTIGAGLPALLATSASAAPATQISITPTSDSAATGTCTTFTVNVRDASGNTPDTATVTVQLNDPSPANNTTAGATNNDDLSAQFCTETGTNGSSFALDASSGDNTLGSSTSNQRTRTFQVTNGTVTFGVVDSQQETVTLRAFLDQNGDGTFDPSTDTRSNDATATFTAGNDNNNQAPTQAANDAVRTITEQAQTGNTTVVAGTQQRVDVILRNANGDEVSGATPQILVQSGGANSNGTTGNPTSGTGQRAGDSCTASDNNGLSTCFVQVDNAGTDQFLIFVNQTNGGTPGPDASEPQLVVTRTTTTAPNTNANEARFLDLTPEGPVDTTTGGSRTFTASVTDATGKAVQGVQVDFTRTGAGRFTGASGNASNTTFNSDNFARAETNNLGQATVTITSAAGETGQAVVTATITEGQTQANGFTQTTECANAANSPTTGDAAGNCADTEVTNFVAASASPSASPSTAPASPSASPAGPPATPCTVPASITLDRDTITATGSAQITVRATPNSVVQVFAYSRPSTTYRVVRNIEIGGDGVATDRIVPPTNTRLYAQQQGCNASPSIVLNVRTQISLNVVRNGVRNYTFSGRLLPARPNGLIASLYRVTNDGRQILTAQTRANAAPGQAGYDSSRVAGSYTIVRQFTGTGRFGFVVRTGQDLQNAPGSSNVRSLLVY